MCKIFNRGETRESHYPNEQYSRIFYIQHISMSHLIFIFPADIRVPLSCKEIINTDSGLKRRDLSKTGSRKDINIMEKDDVGLN